MVDTLKAAGGSTVAQTVAVPIFFGFERSAFQASIWADLWLCSFYVLGSVTTLGGLFLAPSV
jgi:hypothetical protein